jgi:TDG/mug DNA glycosylase family protein
MSPEPYVTLPDYLPPHPDVLFVGINPGTYSAQQGHYYARATNRFWWALHASGLVPVPLSPHDDRRVVEFGLGLTDLVKRPTNSSAHLRHQEFVDGRQSLAAKIRQVQPLIICFNGLTGYQYFFHERPRAGRQSRRHEGAWIFVVPSTSARNAAYARDVILAHFRELKALRDALRQCSRWHEG